MKTPRPRSRGILDFGRVILDCVERVATSQRDAHGGLAPVLRQFLSENLQSATSRRQACRVLARKGEWPRGRYLQLGKSDLTARRGSGGLLSALRQFLSENLLSATNCRQGARGVGSQGDSGRAGDTCNWGKATSQRGAALAACYRRCASL